MHDDGRGSPRISLAKNEIFYTEVKNGFVSNSSSSWQLLLRPSTASKSLVCGVNRNSRRLIASLLIPKISSSPLRML